MKIYDIGEVVTLFGDILIEINEIPTPVNYNSHARQGFRSGKEYCLEIIEGKIKALTEDIT